MGGMLNNSMGRAGMNYWWPVILGVLVLIVPSYYGLANNAWNTEGQAHGPIVLAVVLWILWQKRHKLNDVQDCSSPVLGALFLGFGLLLYVVGRSQSVPIFEIGSQVPIFAGMILFLRGANTLRILWFPVIFLLFLVPLPGVILDALTGPLKFQVSNLVENILYFFGYPIARSGVVINIGQYQLLVADACSGLNSMYSLSALGLLYVYLMERDEKWRNALLMLSILPIAFFSNMVRIIGLVLLTYYFGDAVGQGFLHEFAGFVLFAFSISTLLAFDKLLGIFTRKHQKVSS